jgi:hypothetical protein
LRNRIITGLMIVVALAAAIVIYLPEDSSNQRQAPTQPVANAERNAKSVTAVAGTPRNSASHGDTASKPLPTDPRLAALTVSPDDGYIEFVVGTDGKVIKEIDKNPSSLGFRKPLREYMYAGERVIGLSAYQYFADSIQITETKVSYKPDGSVDQYRESMSYIYPEKRKHQ